MSGSSNDSVKDLIVRHCAEQQAIKDRAVSFDRIVELAMRQYTEMAELAGAKEDAVAALAKAYLAERDELLKAKSTVSESTEFSMGDAHPCDISRSVREQTFQEVLRSLHDLYNLHRVSGSSDKGHGIALAEQRVRDLAGIKR